MHPQKRQGLIFTLAAVLTGATLLVGVVVYLVLRSVEQPRNTSTEISSPSIPNSTEAPVDTELQVIPEMSPDYVVIPTREPAKNLGGVNWQGRNLTQINLSDANLGGANLANTNLSGVNLSGANLSGANLKAANLENANLTNADLRGANLENANITGANLNGTRLDGANLRGIKKVGSEKNP